MKKEIIKLSNVSKCYKNGEQETMVLKNVNLSMKEGDFICIMGASGSGKSTLLYAMSGLDQVSDGHVYIDDKRLDTLHEKALSAFRLAHMGFVFQQNYLLKNLNIYDNILLPAVQNNTDKQNVLCQRVDMLMKHTGIYELRDHAITAVSGGQLQRVGICRALVNQPKLLFADEPTGALNSKSSKEIMDIFNDLHAQGTSIVLVTHDVKVSVRAEHVIFMKDGEIHGHVELGAYDGQDSMREALLIEKMHELDI